MPCAFAPKAIIVLNRHERDEENPRRGVSAIRQARREGSFSLFLPFHARERKAERGWGGAGGEREGGRDSRAIRRGETAAARSAAEFAIFDSSGPPRYPPPLPPLPPPPRERREPSAAQAADGEARREGARARARARNRVIVAERSFRAAPISLTISPPLPSPPPGEDRAQADRSNSYVCANVYER